MTCAAAETQIRHGTDLADTFHQVGVYTGSTQTCRCCNRPNSSLSSTCKRREHSVSRCRQGFSYSEERNTKTATVTATPTPTPKPAPIATPMPMLATAAPTPAPSTTPTNKLNGKAATPQREIFVPWLRFFPLTVMVPDTGLTRQYQSIRLVSFKPWRNAARRCSVPSGDVLRRNPIAGIAGCCARAAIGHAATPPISVMNSRRLIQSPRRRGRAVSVARRGRAPWRS